MVLKIERAGVEKGVRWRRNSVSVVGSHLATAYRQPRSTYNDSWLKEGHVESEAKCNYQENREENHLEKYLEDVDE